MIVIRKRAEKIELSCRFLMTRFTVSFAGGHSSFNAINSFFLRILSRTGCYPRKHTSYTAVPACVACSEASSLCKSRLEPVLHTRSLLVYTSMKKKRVKLPKGKIRN